MMVDALSGVSAVGPVNAGQAIDYFQSAVSANPLPATDLPNSVSNDLSSLELSTTGQLIETVLGIKLPPTDSIKTLQPLLASPAISGTASSTELAQSLSKALSNSGLFYESHLADWLSGLRTQTQISQEPQSKLTHESLRSHSDVLSDGLSNDLLKSDHTRSESLSSAIHPQTVGILQQQLQALDTQSVPWQGQIWPGQNMEWTVQPETDPDGAHSYSSSPSPVRWKSTLKLSLPHLGDVYAELSLGPQGCQIHLKTETAQVSEVKQALPILETRLKDAGIRAEQLKVQSSELNETKHV